MSKLEVDKIDPQSGTDLELGTSGDTITIPAGVTFDSSAATNTLPSTVVTTTGTQTLTNKSIATTQLTGTVATSNLGTGTADATTFLRGDNTFAAPSGGKVLQVISTHFTDRVSSTSATPADVSGFSATITPSLTSSKILVMVTVFFGGSNSSYAYTLCQRQISGGATTSIGLGTGATGSQTNIFVGRRMDVIQDYGESSINFLDTPNTTSAITYQMQLANPYGTTVYINRQDSAGNFAYISFPSSTITLLEIGA
jgi:hypothetical protein